VEPIATPTALNAQSSANTNSVSGPDPSVSQDSISKDSISGEGTSGEGASTDRLAEDSERSPASEARRGNGKPAHEMPSSTHPQLDRFVAIRSLSESIAQRLSAEDCLVQSMPSASPIKWHLAHTTWFFETFLLKFLPEYTHFNSQFEFLFNSYYNAVGEIFPRSQRGHLSRPSFAETLAYREHVNHSVEQFLAEGDVPSHATSILEIGLHHEQQHQELMLTDIKHALFSNPLRPAFQNGFSSHNSNPIPQAPAEVSWLPFEKQIVEIGAAADGFSFDNETPRHEALLQDFSIAHRTVTNGEFREFMADGGYERPELWLSLGWETVQAKTWRHPLYWIDSPDGYEEFTLSGCQSLNPHAPVTHVSFFEADAYARWSGNRLPTEFEWEHVANVYHAIDRSKSRFSDHLLSENQCLHPCPSQELVQNNPAHPPLRQPLDMLGNVWEWTASPYVGYPGFAALDGALGEYNGKFMCNQFVLRGGSVATPSDHIRSTYRNFFPPEARWQFSGFRLCKS
jgi:ergothioneine biosynthesis protein EgtB